MFYYIINYDNLYLDILSNIKKYCDDFDLSFDEENKKTKKDLYLYFSILEIIKNIKDRKGYEKPILIYGGNESNIPFKEISKILIIPVFKNVYTEITDGYRKELYLKADVYYLKNTFNCKKFNRLISKYKFKNLSQDIKNIKLLVASQ
jgi:hypothetical protein